uniref:Delta-like protein n=1 Tax=Zeugodacus cucurbitae TaxID=28588 RepID=A0A0A1WMS8_ZEUCU
MSCNWLIYLAYFLLAPTLLPAVTYHRRNYDLRYGNSDMPQWKLRACQKTQREKINLHYICDEKGNVKCLPGWQGDLCQVPQCRKGCDPMNGYCQRPDECRCRIGYTGEFCERCIPLPGCQHGYCNKPFECICKPGWDGLFCTEPTCRSGCHNTRGYCEAPGECRCRLGWAGRNCSDCAVLPGCQRGTCQKPLECNCLPGYTGLLCQTAICAAGCHKQRGYCTKPGECRCKVGWTGPNCDQCFAYPGCVNGDCERPWECNCKPGWGGMLCDEKLTYCDEHPNTCENGGRCISFTKDDGSYRCECKQGYLGKNCEILDEFMLTSTAAPRITPPPMPGWGDESDADMLNNDDDDDDGDNRIGSDYQLGTHKVQQNNGAITTTAATISNAAGHSELAKPLQPPTTQLYAGTVTTLTAVDKMTNLNDTKSIVAHYTNNIKPPEAAAVAVQPTVSVQLPQAARNATDVQMQAATTTSDTTTTASKRTHLNLINATVSALSAEPALPGREADENSTIKSAPLANRTHSSSSTTPATPTAISSPIPIPLHFLEPALTHNEVTHTAAATVNSNLAAASGNNAADEDANRDEYEEDGDDEDDDDEEGDDDDEEGDDDDDDDDEDEDDLIPDVLNSVA